MSSILVMALLAGSSVAMPQPVVAGAVANPVNGGLVKAGGAGPIKTQVMPNTGANVGNLNGNKKKKSKATTPINDPVVNGKDSTGGKDKKKTGSNNQTGVNGNTGGKDKKKTGSNNQTGVNGNTGAKDKKKKTGLNNQTGVNGNTGAKDKKKKKTGLNNQTGIKGNTGAKDKYKDKKLAGAEARKAIDARKKKGVAGATSDKTNFYGNNNNRPVNNYNQQPSYYNNLPSQNYGSQNSYNSYTPPAYTPPSYNTPSYTPSYNAQPAYAAPAPAAQYYNSYPRNYYRR
jgi:hypothetical protein